MNKEHNHDKIEDQNLEIDQSEQGDEVEMYIPNNYTPSSTSYETNNKNAKRSQ